jgi:hypothetical protein
MSKIFPVLRSAFLAIALLAGTCPAWAAPDTCFWSSKIYQIHPAGGGPGTKDGWRIQGDAFAQCVHRAEAADKAFHARYPDGQYQLALAATIGCHSPC